MSILGARIKLTTWEKTLIYITFTILISILLSMKINEIETNKAEEIHRVNNAVMNDAFERYTTNSANTINNNTTNVTNTSQNSTSNNTSKKIEDSYNADEKKAIELVKNKWDENDGSVSFNIADNDGKIYHISVNNPKTTEVIAWYEVNVESGEVSDY